MLPRHASCFSPATAIGSVVQTAPLERVADGTTQVRMAEPTHGTFRLGWLRSGSRLTSEETAPSASGAQHEMANELAHVLDTTEMQAGGLCGQVAAHPRAPRPPRVDLECLSDSQTLSAPGSRDSSPGLPPSPPMSESAPSPKAASPMARTLSFARRPLSKEEEAELYAAAPDEVLSPGSAQVLRSALQAEADETIVASSLVCPITNELMTDPVFTMDGQVSPTHTHTYTQTLTMTHAQTLPLTLTLTSTLPLPLTRRTSARLSRRGCATTTPRPPPASRCHPRS